MHDIIKVAVSGNAEIDRNTLNDLLTSVNKIFGVEYSDLVLVDTYGDVKQEDQGDILLVPAPTLTSIELLTDSSEDYITSGVFASLSEAYPSQLSPELNPGESIIRCGPNETWLQEPFTQWPSNSWVKFPTTTDDSAYQIYKVVRTTNYTSHYITGIIPASQIGSGTPIYVLGSGDVTYTVSIDWTSDEAHNSFEIFRNGVLLSTLGYTSNFVDTHIVRGELYTYGVKGIDAAGVRSKTSNTLTIKAGEDIIPPVLEAIETRSDGSVALSWSSVPGAVEYNVYRDGLIVSVQASTSLVQEAQTLTPGTNYTYFIKSVTDDGVQSVASNEESVVPLEPLLAPTITTITYESDTEITVNWVYHNEGITKGSVYLDGVFHEDVTFPGTSLAITLAEPNTETEVRVSAWLDGRESDLSIPMAAFPAEDPHNDMKVWINTYPSIRYTNGVMPWPVDNTLDISWEYKGTGECSYVRYRYYPKNGDPELTGTISGYTGTFTFNGTTSDNLPQLIIERYSSSNVRQEQISYSLNFV
jgi:hypothetical protein